MTVPQDHLIQGTRFSEFAPSAKFVVLSKRSTSKDLRNYGILRSWSVRRSFDFLRSLRMTEFSFLRIRRHAFANETPYCGTVITVPYIGIYRRDNPWESIPTFY